MKYRFEIRPSKPFTIVVESFSGISLARERAIQSYFRSLAHGSYPNREVGPDFIVVREGCEGGVMNRWDPHET